MSSFARRFLTALLVVSIALVLLLSFVGAWMLPMPGNFASAATLALVVGCVLYGLARP